MKEQLPCSLRLTVHKFNIGSFLMANNNNNNNYYYSNNNNGKKMNKNHSTLQINGKKQSSFGYYNTNGKYRSNLNISNNNFINHDDRMVDVDLDPTYQRILENFRKAMAHCN